MILTREILDKGKSSRGGWNRDQVETLGVEWPLTTGWKRKILGRDYPAEQIVTFLMLRNSHIKSTYSSRNRPIWIATEPPSQDIIDECPFDLLATR